MYSIRAFDTITGERLVSTLGCSEGQWKSTLAHDGDGTFTVRTGDPRFDLWTPAFWDRVRSRQTTIVPMIGQTPRYAGVVVDSDYDRDAGTLTFKTLEVTETLRRRLFKGAGTYDKKGIAKRENLSTRGLIVELLRIIVGGGKTAPIDGTQTPWQLPVVLPTAPTGTRSFESLEHKFERPWELIQALLTEPGGPDVAFAPALDAFGSLLLNFEVGTPRLDASRHEFDVTAADSPISGFKHRRDALSQFTGLQVTGEGMDEGTIVESVPRGTGSRTPAMDSVLAIGREENRTKLRAAGEGRLDVVREPIVTSPFQVKVTAAPTLRPGSRVRLRAHKERVLGDYARDFYVTSVSENIRASKLVPEVIPL